MNSKELAEFYESREKRHTFCIKEEVAREIFEEIEKHIQEKKKAISMFKDGEDDFYDGVIHALEVFAHMLTNLKKKYIGE